jgi:adenosylmethionine-8-amino-7-oxononanoate aminotransferase
MNSSFGETIWHPYTQMKTAPPPIRIVRGQGAVLIDENGKAYIDAISSWWLNIHGHCNPYIAAKVHEQLQKLEHVIFAGFTHHPAIELSQRLLRLLPPNQKRVFFSDNGSTAVEVALKMAIQFRVNQGIKKGRIIAFENAYHGDTFGAMSVSGRGAFVRPFEPYLFDVTHLPVPLPGEEEQSVDAFRREIARGDVAAVIFEPLIQGAAGMVMYDPKALDELINLCATHGVITIADEVMTGFGRTGKAFAVDYLNHKPDIICLSKGLTGGTMPLAVTSCSDLIFRAFFSEDKQKAFFHGHSYTANPVGCSAALASLDLFETDECRENIGRIQRYHNNMLSRLANHPSVAKVRMLGTILAVEIQTAEETSYFNNLRDSLYEFFIQEGVLLRPLGNVVYILPPYCITDQQLERVYDVLLQALNKFGK